ncbi:MAG TPA: peptidoglycan bridge formation glycyltransferase FemA/FemB family protein [Patescibacteria group bacterium]|nr:peptidoglycan bridge formation glycyltransferase FemA/FemB family protein [Patescibacteria group bacterium]
MKREIGSGRQTIKYNWNMNSDDWNKNAGHPMQSFEWGEFREKVGNKISRVVGDKQYQIIWSRIKPFDLWFGYCPMSGMPNEKDIKILRDEAIKNNGLGIRFEPNEMKGAKIPERMVSGRHLFKPKTFQIDLTLGEDELLNRMHPKCRYNIRLAQKHGVKIGEGDIESYVKLIFGKTVKRQKIYSHSEKYHWELAQLGWVHLFKAEYKNKVIASWMVFAWKNFVYYAYGAFDDDYKNLMAPVLGLWEIIRWGKREGFKTLDLWGAEEGRGFSRFKQQFGPELVEMVGTYDLPINFLHWPFRMAEEIRWKILRILK